MFEKFIQRLPHWCSGVQMVLGALWGRLHGFTLYEMVLLMSLILSPLAFLFSIYFQWRQTRAIERGAMEGRIVKPRRLFK